MNLRTFFEIASPTTLASLIADVHAAGTGASADQLALARRAEQVLRAMVGEEETRQLIDAAMVL